MDRYVFNPFTVLMILLLIGVFLLVLPLLLLSIIGTAFLKLGFSWREILLILLLTLVGSFINIPLTTIQGEPRMVKESGWPYGFFYRIREVTPTTTVAINVGGAILPIGISLYLLYNAVTMLGNPAIAFLSGVGILIVAVIVKLVARPVQGLGIVTPFFVPPFAALLCGLILSVWAGGETIAAAIIAYTSGTMGTLIGADLLNLYRIKDLSSPMVSIGGAGTFDGVFLSGVIAAFLA
jgi:uncharacterized membrane protein